MIVETVRAMLTALDEQGQGDWPDWNQRVSGATAALEASYRVLRDRNRNLIDYSELPVQASYVYRYVIGHAEFIYEILSRARTAKGTSLFSDEELWVTSVGGGPGSELLGLLKYLANNDDEPKVRKIVYTVIDKEANWSHVIDLLVNNVESDINIDVLFQTFDISSPSLPDGVTLSEEDLVMMSFFISEVCAIPNGRQVVDNTNDLLSKMKKESLLLYNDSSAYSFYSFFDNRVNAARHFKEIIEIRENLSASSPQHDGIFEEYALEHNYSFKLSSNAVAKVLRRVVP